LGQFRAPPAKPGSQGLHLVLATDYQAEVPNFGTLLVGTIETRPDALEAALSRSTTVDFLRVKNSWGDRGAHHGYYDLWMAYLTGPIPACADSVEDKLGRCISAGSGTVTPLYQVVLPPGY